MKAKLELPNNVLYYVKQEEDFIVTLNREQLRIGVRSDNSLMPKYSPITIDIKREKKRIWVGERIGLADTGSFWSKMYLIANKDGLSVLSSDEKTNKLRFTYGRQIFGLTPKNMLYFRSVIQKPIIDALKNKIYGL